MEGSLSTAYDSTARHFQETRVITDSPGHVHHAPAKEGRQDLEWRACTAYDSAARHFQIDELHQKLGFWRSASSCPEWRTPCAIKIQFHHDFGRKLALMIQIVRCFRGPPSN